MPTDDKKSSLINVREVPDAIKINVRLKCAEIVFLTGSQEHKEKLEHHGERLYRFVMGLKE